MSKLYLQYLMDDWRSCWLQVAVEFDGPYHFTVNTQQPMGPALLRRRTMQALGWTLISVPFYHWHSLASVPDKVRSPMILWSRACSMWVVGGEGEGRGGFSFVMRALRIIIACHQRLVNEMNA